jgi:hypothetical protein
VGRPIEGLVLMDSRRVWYFSINYGSPSLFLPVVRLLLLVNTQHYIHLSVYGPPVPCMFSTEISSWFANPVLTVKPSWTTCR